MARPRRHDSKLPLYVRIRNGSYLYKDKKLCRVSDGEAAMYTALAKQKLLPSIDMVPAAVAEFKLDYLKTLAPSTQKEHSRILDVFADEFSEYKVDQVTAVAVKRSMRNLYRDKLSAARAYKARVSTFFSWCVTEEGLCTVNPCKEIRSKKTPAKKTPWTPALFHAARGKLEEMMQCYHDLSYYLIQRTTDVRYLERAQVDKDAGVIRFTPSKTEDSSGLGIDVPITPEIQDALDRAAAISRKWKVVCGYVIHTRQGTPYTRSGVYSAYLRADKALHGKKTPIGLNPKALRPFATTEAKKQGFDLDQLQTQLAHTARSTTEGYIHTHGTPRGEIWLRAPVKPK